MEEDVYDDGKLCYLDATFALYLIRSLKVKRHLAYNYN
jgi:hypothetical protein